MPKFHRVTGTTLFIWLLILSSIAKRDSHSNDDSSNYITQDDITDVSKQYLFYTQATSYILRSSESGENPFPNCKSFLASTSTSLTLSVSKANTIRTSNSPSSPIHTADLGSKKVATPSDTIVDDRDITGIPSGSKPTTVNQETERSSFPSTTVFPTTLSITNPCDTDQVVVSDEPVQLYADTNATSCNLLVNTKNSTAISVTLLKSDINNVYTYFYVEILENSPQIYPERYLLVSDSHTPCHVIIPGNQFRFYFQNTEMMLEMHTISTFYDTQIPLMEFKICNVTSYESEIKWSQKTQTFHYGRSWSLDRIKLNVVQYHAMCTCNCSSKCLCTLGYKEWLSECIDSKDSTKRADLIVYTPYAKALSFAKSGMHMIQQHAFLGLESLKVLILSHNTLTTLPPTACQNLPQLTILSLKNNRLANLSFDTFKVQCEGQLLRIELNSNELTHTPHDLFKTASNLKTLYLSQNRLIHLSNDSFTTLIKLEILFLNDISLFTLTQGVFASLGELRILNLSANAIFTLPQGVFASQGNLLTLLLSSNDITILPRGVFASLGSLRTGLLPGHLFSSGEMAGDRSKISSALNRLALEIPLDLYCVVFTNIIEHTWEWVQLSIINTLCQYRLTFQSVIFKIYSITRNSPTLKLKLSFGTNFLSNFLKGTTR